MPRAVSLSPLARSRNRLSLPVILVMTVFLCLSPLIGRSIVSDAVVWATGHSSIINSDGGPDADVAIPESSRTFQLITRSTLTAVIIAFQVVVLQRLAHRDRLPGLYVWMPLPPLGRHSRPVLSAFRN